MSLTPVLCFYCLYPVSCPHPLSFVSCILSPIFSLLFLSLVTCFWTPSFVSCLLNYISCLLNLISWFCILNSISWPSLITLPISGCYTTRISCQTGERHHPARTSLQEASAARRGLQKPWARVGCNPPRGCCHHWVSAGAGNAQVLVFVRIVFPLFHFNVQF